MSKHVGEKCGKLWRTDGRTDGRRPGQTDGRTDGHHHTIIRPVWRRAYKNECHYFHLVGEGRRGGSMFLKTELYSIKKVNSTGEKSQVRGVITKWGGGAHIALLPVTSKIISINIHVHYIFLMTVIFQLLSICQNRLDPS